eukprot:6470956-Prymnesium_polylepis.2
MAISVTGVSGQQLAPGQQLASGHQLAPGQQLASGHQLAPGQTEQTEQTPHTHDTHFILTSTLRWSRLPS